MIKNFLKEFKEFAVKGNVLDMAIGIIIGGAFSPIVSSLVNDIIMPPIGFVLGNVDFSNLYLPLAKIDGELPTLEQAQAQGIVTINYGLFINTLISFIIVSFAVFMLVKVINKIKRDDVKAAEVQEAAEPTEKECPYCFSTISIKATKCPHCTSELPRE